MSSITKATLHLQIANFNFSHIFIICDRLLETDFIFYIDLLKQYSLSYCLDLDRHLFTHREGAFLTYTRNREELNNIAVVKSTLQIPPRHNGTIPVRIMKHDLKDQVAHFISNQHTKKGFNPNVNVIDSINNIKGKLMLYLMVTNYTNKNVTFNQGEGIGHMELPINNMS